MLHTVEATTTMLYAEALPIIGGRAIDYDVPITQVSSGRTSTPSATQQTPSTREMVQCNRDRQDCSNQRQFAFSPEFLAKLDTPEWCGCTIENWASFTAGETRPRIRNELFSYNYVLIPELRRYEEINIIYFNLFAYKSFSRDPHELPSEKKLELRFLHTTDKARDMLVCEDVCWEKLHPTITINGEKVYFVGSSKHYVSPGRMETGGFVADDKLSLLFKATP
nr:uncharacterized protein LOC126516406 [Dermacentor andersoni]